MRNVPKYVLLLASLNLGAFSKKKYFFSLRRNCYVSTFLRTQNGEKLRSSTLELSKEGPKSSWLMKLEIINHYIIGYCILDFHVLPSTIPIHKIDSVCCSQNLDMHGIIYFMGYLLLSYRLQLVLVTSHDNVRALSRWSSNAF